MTINSPFYPPPSLEEEIIFPIISRSQGPSSEKFSSLRSDGGKIATFLRITPNKVVCSSEGDKRSL